MPAATGHTRRHHDTHTRWKTLDLGVGQDEKIWVHTFALTVGKGIAVEPGSLRVGTKRFGGVVIESIGDNTGNPDGALYPAKMRTCTVSKTGVWYFDLHTADGVPDLHQDLYIYDNNTVTAAAMDGATSRIKCGHCVDIAPDGKSVGVDISVAF